MADEAPKRKTRKARRRPPSTDREWPVDEADVERMADAALDEPAMQADEDLVRGGPDPDEGFARTVAEARARARRLASDCPDPRHLLSARRRKAFLMAIAQTGNVTIAAAAAGWPRSFAYSLRKEDRDFADKWEHASEMAADLLEAEAYRRAVHGVQEEIWHKPKDGDPIVLGHRTIYSDKLMDLLLKANKPEKFRERHEVKHDGAKGGVLVVPGTASLEEWTAAAFSQQAKYREKREDDQ